MLEVSQIDQVAGRITQHHPARSRITFDAPRQIDIVGAQVLDRRVEIIDGNRDDRKAGRSRIERRKRPALLAPHATVFDGAVHV